MPHRMAQAIIKTISNATYRVAQAGADLGLLAGGGLSQSESCCSTYKPGGGEGRRHVSFNLQVNISWLLILQSIH